MQLFGGIHFLWGRVSLVTISLLSVISAQAYRVCVCCLQTVSTAKQKLWDVNSFDDGALFHFAGTNGAGRKSTLLANKTALAHC